MFIQKYNIGLNNSKKSNCKKWWLVRSYKQLKQSIVKPIKAKEIKAK